MNQAGEGRRARRTADLNDRSALRVLLAVVWLVLAWAVGAGMAPAAAPPQLRYVVIISRHGVRSPTWTSDRLNQYSAEPWPDFGVPPGYLTPHGRVLMQLMGTYYREWLTSGHLLSPQGCEDAGRIYIHADTDQRTLETGRALAETLLPGCTVVVHSAPEGSHDPLFGGAGKPDPDMAAQAVQQRLAGKTKEVHRAAFMALQEVLTGGTAPQKLLEIPDEITVAATGKGVQLNESLSVASTLGENLLLEYTDGMQGKDLGWGRLDADNLLRILELHALASDLTRRTPYLARAKGSNLLEHVLLSMQQAETGKAVPGALGPPATAVLILAGHDTNLANLSGMLGLTWHLPGYQPDDTPPGGALICSLWQQPGTAKYFVRAEYLAQTLEQMRSSTPVTLAAPPAREDLALPSYEPVKPSTGCSWQAFEKSLQKAIDTRFVAM